MAKISFPGGTNAAEKRAKEQAKHKGFKKGGAGPSKGKLK